MKLPGKQSSEILLGSEPSTKSNTLYMARPGPSILNMAEAMLAEEYRSSHDNLKQWADENGRPDSEKGDKKRNYDEDGGTNEANMEQQKQQQDKCDESKAEHKSVVIHLPPKRRKISNACLFHSSDVVQGACQPILRPRIPLVSTTQNR
jgi:hypothetical protein